MDIPIYTASEAANAVTEGAFELTGFRSFIQTIVADELFDKEKMGDLFSRVLNNGTAELSAEELQVLHSYIQQFNATCQRCGERFTWDEMDAYNQELYCSNCRSELEAGDQAF